MFYNILCFVGLYALICYLYDNLKSPIYITLHCFKKLRGAVKSQHFNKKYANWAVITGSTDGIGKAYARQLAKKGFNLILISRNQNKLNKVAYEIQRDFQIETFTIAADFAEGPKVYENIENKLEHKEVCILGQNFPGMLATLDPSEVWSMLYTNVGAVAHLSAFFMRRMHEQGIRGAIINISSGTELQPTPFAALYAASKAFTRSLTLSLQSEARPYGITVQLVSPGFVRTKINAYLPGIMRGGVLIPEADIYAAWAIETLDVVGETTGYIWHGFQSAFMKLFPWQLRTFVSKLGLQYLAEGKLKSLTEEVYK